MPVLEETTRESTARAIYRCRDKNCKAVKTVDYRKVSTTIVAQVPGGGRISRNTYSRLFTADGSQYMNTSFTSIPNVDCQCGTRYMSAAWVKGTKSDRKCDPRCTGAVGNKCECSCAGANHAGGHL